MKTIILGDVHIGRSLSMGKVAVGDGLNSRIVDQIKLLNWVQSKAVENDVEQIIITGDIFEEPKPDNYLVYIFIDWLKQCTSHNINVHIVCGNHDVRRLGNRFTSVLDVISAAEIEGVHIYNTIYTLHTEKTSFTFLPFRDRRSLSAANVEEGLKQISDRLPYELAECPLDNTKILIGHMALEGSMYVDEVDDLSNELMCPLDMFAGYDYVWMGHVHKPQTLSVKPYIAHIGSMDISDSGETKHNKVIILFDHDKNKFMELDIPVRPVRRVKLEVPRGNDPTVFVTDFIEDMNIKEPFADALVKVEVKILDTEAAELSREKVKQAIFGLGAYNIYGFVESRTVALVKDDKKDFESKMDEKSAVQQFAENLEFENDQEKADYLNLAFELIEEVKAE